MPPRPRVPQRLPSAVIEINADEGYWPQLHTREASGGGGAKRKVITGCRNTYNKLSCIRWGFGRSQCHLAWSALLIRCRDSRRCMSLLRASISSSIKPSCISHSSLAFLSANRLFRPVVLCLSFCLLFAAFFAIISRKLEIGGMVSCRQIEQVNTATTP